MFIPKSTVFIQRKNTFLVAKVKIFGAKVVFSTLEQTNYVTTI